MRSGEARVRGYTQIQVLLPIYTKRRAVLKYSHQKSIELRIKYIQKFLTPHTHSSSTVYIYILLTVIAKGTLSIYVRTCPPYQQIYINKIYYCSTAQLWIIFHLQLIRNPIWKGLVVMFQTFSGTLHATRASRSVL